MFNNAAKKPLMLLQYPVKVKLFFPSFMCDKLGMPIQRMDFVGQKISAELIR
jgi:hypothetical protein